MTPDRMRVGPLSSRVLGRDNILSPSQYTPSPEMHVFMRGWFGDDNSPRRIIPGAPNRGKLEASKILLDLGMGTGALYLAARTLRSGSPRVLGAPEASGGSFGFKV